MNAAGACQAVKSGSHLMATNPRRSVPSTPGLPGLTVQSFGNLGYLWAGWPVCLCRKFGDKQPFCRVPDFPISLVRFSWPPHWKGVNPMKLSPATCYRDLSLGRTYCCGPPVFTSTYSYPVGFRCDYLVGLAGLLAGRIVRW